VVQAEQAADVEIGNVYERENREGVIDGVEASLEVFHSTVDQRMTDEQQSYFCLFGCRISVFSVIPELCGLQ